MHGKVKQQIPLTHQSLCSLPSLQRVHQMADNVNLSIKAFSCASFEARGTQKATFDAIWFQNVCVHEELEDRPVVYVNGPHFYFNVTKSLVVQDVVFDGINAFGRIERAP